MLAMRYFLTINWFHAGSLAVRTVIEPQTYNFPGTIKGGWSNVLNQVNPSQKGDINKTRGICSNILRPRGERRRKLQRLRHVASFANIAETLWTARAERLHALIFPYIDSRYVYHQSVTTQ